MTTTVPDPWADAWQAATQPVLEPRLAEVRRRIRLRRLAGIVAVGVALLVGSNLTLQRLGSSDSLWPTSTTLFVTAVALSLVGFALMIGGAVRTSSDGLYRSLVGPDAFLPTGDRAWVRAQIADALPVPPGRVDVVSSVAHRMRAEGNKLLTYLGVCVAYAGMLVAGPSAATLVVFGVLIASFTVISVRAVVWSRRADRWLSVNG